MSEINAQVENFFSKFDNEETELVDFSESLPETPETPKEEPKEVITPKVEEKEVSKEAETETKEIEVDDNTPFHKHPRWQQKLQENKDLKNKYADSEKKMQDLMDRLDNLESKPKTDEELEWMTPKEIQDYTREQYEKETSKKQTQDKLADEEADRTINEALEAIKDTWFDLTEDIENEIFKIADDYTEWEIGKAFELYQKFNNTKEQGKQEEAKETAKKKAAESNRSNRGSSWKVSWYVRWTWWGNLDLK